MTESVAKKELERYNARCEEDLDYRDRARIAVHFTCGCSSMAYFLNSPFFNGTPVICGEHGNGIETIEYLGTANNHNEKWESMERLYSGRWNRLMR